jgi:hypothetical protein
LQQLFGLCYEYENRNGASLVLFRDPGIREDELSRIQTKMLLTGQVHRLLPFVAEHLDDSVRLVYHIGSRRMLRQALRTERLTAFKALQLLVSVAAMLEECRSYMLQESGFILRETFLFIGADLSDVSFVYVPLTHREAPPAAEELECFIRTVADYVSEEERDALLPLADYCRSGAFRIKELKRRLIERLTAASMTTRNGGGRETSGLSFPERSDSPAGGYLPIRTDEPVWNDPLLDWAAAEVSSAADAAVAADAADATQPAARSRQRLSTAAAGAGAVVSAWLWYRWLEQPSPPLLHLGIGVTLLSLDAWLLIRFAVPQQRMEAVLRRLAKRTPAPPVAPQSLPAPKAGQTEERASLPAGPEFVPTQSKPLSVPIDPQEYYASLARYTTLLRRPADATVLLRPAAASKSQHDYAFLESVDAHPPIRIQLGKEPFVIGRSGEYTDYRLEADGVSRQHVEIVREGGVYAAKDLGSTNGTLWNGESMIPYRAYPLREGDCLTIAHMEFRFRCVENVRKTV